MPPPVTCRVASASSAAIFDPSPTTMQQVQGSNVLLRGCSRVHTCRPTRAGVPELHAALYVTAWVDCLSAAVLCLLDSALQG